MPVLQEQDAFVRDHSSLTWDAAQTTDLGFSRWETSWRRSSLSNRYFETFLARPRQSKGPYSFILKALREEFCGSADGVALVERERAIGSVDCRRIPPVVDFDYPKRVSSCQATRGYLVFPFFQGHTLAKVLQSGARLNASCRELIRKSFKEIETALETNGWRLTDIKPKQLLLTFEQDYVIESAPTNFMLVDPSDAFRFAAPSLFSNAFEKTCPFSPTFDQQYLLLPNTFHRDGLDRDATENAYLSLLESL